MPYGKQTWEDKPYNRCIDCKNLGVNCDGPNFLAMTPERLGEWCKLRKQFLNTKEPGEWTLEKIEEKSGVSAATISRILGGDLSDRKLSYITAVIKVLVNGTWGQYPCTVGDDSETRHLAEECERLKAALEETRAADRRSIDFLKGQVAEKDKQIASKDERLAERRDFIYLKDDEIKGLKRSNRLYRLGIIAYVIFELITPFGTIQLANWLS